MPRPRAHSVQRDVFTKTKFYNEVAKQSMFDMMFGHVLIVVGLFVSVHDAVLYALAFSGLPSYLADDCVQELEQISRQHIELMERVSKKTFPVPP